jgi:CBS domain-containing protein
MVEDVVTVREDITIHEAIRMLWEKHIGSVVVTDSSCMCRGIFTERDAIRVVAQKVDLTLPLEKVMTRKIVTIPVDATLAEARRAAISHSIRHLPVVDGDGKLVGLLTIRAILDEFFGI